MGNEVIDSCHAREEQPEGTERHTREIVEARDYTEVRILRIGIAGFSDETCTFCKEPTTEDRFAVLKGEEILAKNRGIPTYIHGYMRVLEEAGADTVPLVYAEKAMGGFSSWLTTECFDSITAQIQDALRETGTLDGVLLSLHGAMAVTGVPKPEAEIVRRVREVVGDIPVMVTLDLHANEDHELIEAADGVFILKTYPHVDSEQIGMTAATCMLKTLSGELRPVQAIRRPGIVSASIYQASEYPPMKLIYDRCRQWEKEPGVYCVSCAPGYAYADVVDIGMCVIAITDNDKMLAERVAEDVSQLAWSLKQSFSEPLPNTEQSVALAEQAVREGRGPVLIADGADRIGDSTHLLRELLRQNSVNWAIPCLVDSNVVRNIEQTQRIGDSVSVVCGGWYDEFSGTPVEVSGQITFMGRPSFVLAGPMAKGLKVQDGLVVHLDLGNNRHVVLAEKMRWTLDGSSFEAVGIDYRDLDIIVLKDRVHHRAFWDSVTKTNIRTSVPGQGPSDLSTLRYENAPDDAYPIGKRWRE